jgi:hypothetical protein
MKKRPAAIIIVILVISAGAGAFIFMRMGPDVPVQLQKSNRFGNLVIQEVYPHSNASLTEFIEIQHRVNSTVNLQGWSVTDFDGGPYLLPEISGVGYLSLLTIYTGAGVSDLNATDGRAVVFLNLVEDIFGSSEEEVALLDDNDEVVDYVHYGDGTPTLSDAFWSEDGDSLETTTHGFSVQLFGPDRDSPENWESTPATPEALNVLPDTTQDALVVFVVNGVDDELEGDIVLEADPQRVRRYPGVNLSVCQDIHEMVDFTMHLLLGEGYVGPRRAADGRLYVDVAESSRNFSMGQASTSGRIRIWVGQQASKVELKSIVEHEVAHMFQYALRERFNGDAQAHIAWPSDQNNWWNEGFAEYWGIESAKRNYNKTTEEVHAARHVTGCSNWWDHGRDTNVSIFVNWSRTYGWNGYQVAYQFHKFLIERYGSENVSAIYHAIWYDVPGAADNVHARQALEQVLNKTLDEVLTEFYHWKVLDREGGDIPECHIHYNITISDDNPSEEITEAAWPGGALVQRVVVNGSYPIRVRFSENAENWTAVVILKFIGGSTINVTMCMDQEFILLPGELKEVIIIKIRGLDDPNAEITFFVEQEREESAVWYTSTETLGTIVECSSVGNDWEESLVRGTDFISAITFRCHRSVVLRCRTASALNRMQQESPETDSQLIVGECLKCE